MAATRQPITSCSYHGEHKTQPSKQPDTPYLLLSHGQTGVVASHYRNNPKAALPEKRRAVELFDGALALVLGEVKGRAKNVFMLA
jgi:hypothetical protein